MAAEAMSVGEFSERVSLILMLYRGSVTSWGRTPDRQRAVGENRFSWHNLFLAVDVVLDIPLMHPDVIALAKRMGLEAMEEGDHLHIEVAI